MNTADMEELCTDLVFLVIGAIIVCCMCKYKGLSSWFWGIVVIGATCMCIVAQQVIHMVFLRMH